MKKLINEQLQEILTQYEPSKVLESASYSLIAPGKRVRPLLMLALIKDYGHDPYLGTDAALALELIQTYSIVHDDLPAMDDDDYRRGQLSNHKVFGEANAVLAGSALLTAAFETLVSSTYNNDIKVKLVELFSRQAGLNGMILGQSIDLELENKEAESLDLILKMYDLKTGCLLATALETAAILVNKESDRETLRSIGYKCGRAFQIQDDVFDATKETEELGKTTGSDVDNKKVTALDFLSIDEANELVASLYQEIRNELQVLNLNNSEIYNMIEYLMNRQT